MNNKLQALERAKTEHSIIKQGFPEQEYIKTLDEIEKSLEALEIIKEKQVNVENFINTCSKMSYEQYKFMWEKGCFMGVKMTSKEFLIKDEYDLLKEILTCTNV